MNELALIRDFRADVDDADVTDEFAREILRARITAETHRLRVRSRRVALPPLAAVLVALALLLVGPWRDDGPSVVDRALGAVGPGPVVHAVVEYSGPQDVVVDLASGAELERVHRDEFWYDEERRQLLHRSVTTGGEPTEYLLSGAALPGRLDPALTGFATQYREALATGSARVVGDTTVDGRPAKRIEFAPTDGAEVEEVVVDAQTYAPLRFHSDYPGGRRSPTWRVVTIESVPRDSADFRESPQPPQLTAGEVTDGHNASLPEAEQALGRPALWLGPAFKGRALSSVELWRSTARLSDGSKYTGALVRLNYGRVRVSQARDRGGSYAVGFGEDGHPTPPEGSIAISGDDRDGWAGELRHDEYAVAISAPTKQDILAVARALTTRN